MRQNTLPLPTPLGAAHVNTPWGNAQGIEPIAPGLAFVSTASHGGFWLSPERAADMPEPYKSIPTFPTGSKWHDGSKWYEEDCDWSIVVLAFPDLFPEREIEQARPTFDYWILQRRLNGKLPGAPA